MPKIKPNINRFIAISGQAGSGKDTAADFLVSEWGFVKVSLADPLKRYVKDAFKFTDQQMWGPSSERNKPDDRYKVKYRVLISQDETEERERTLIPREPLQKGGEGFRNAYPDVWANYLIEVAKEILWAIDTGAPLRYTPQSSIKYNARLTPCPYNGVVVADCRYINEIKLLRDAGAKLVRIVGFGKGLDGEMGQHHSETEMSRINDSEFDLRIVNGGTKEELKEKICSIVNL